MSSVDISFVVGDENRENSCLHVYDRKMNTVYIDFAPVIILLSVIMPFLISGFASLWSVASTP